MLVGVIRREAATESERWSNAVQSLENDNQRTAVGVEADQIVLNNELRLVLTTWREVCKEGFERACRKSESGKGRGKGEKEIRESV